MRVIRRSCLQVRCYLTASVCYVCVVLLRVDGSGRINRDRRVLALVDVLILMAAGAATLVCYQVLCAGALLLTFGLACACHILRILVFLVILWLNRRSPCTNFGVFSTLRTSVGDTLGTSGVSFIVDLVSCLSVFSNGCIVFALGSEWVIPSSFLHWCVGLASMVW